MNHVADQAGKNGDDDSESCNVDQQGNENESQCVFIVLNHWGGKVKTKLLRHDRLF